MRTVARVRTINRVPKKIAAGFGVLAASVMVLLAPPRVAAAIGVATLAAVLAVIGAAVFDVRRRLATIAQQFDETAAAIAALDKRVMRLRKPRTPPVARERPEQILQAASIRTDDRVRLGTINQLFLRANLAPLTLRNPTGTLNLDNLSTAISGHVTEQPTVSVIMSVYNGQDTITYAVRSVLEQTWSNLQVIVVDDGSDDDTLKAVSEIAGSDSRIRIVPLPANQGAFAARNVGMAHAEGDFITTHDSDDWSHAQTIEAQARHLLTDESLVGTVSYATRCHDDLTPVRRSWNKGYLRACPATLMVRRLVFDDVGAWDQGVRGGADTEFISRLRAHYGRNAVRYIMDAVPFTLTLLRDDSLTGGSSPNGLATMQDGLGSRNLYLQAYKRWHKSDDFGSDLPWNPGNPRPFPCPPSLATADAPKTSHP